MGLTETSVVGAVVVAAGVKRRVSWKARGMVETREAYVRMFFHEAQRQS